MLLIFSSTGFRKRDSELPLLRKQVSTHAFHIDSITMLPDITLAGSCYPHFRTGYPPINRSLFLGKVKCSQLANRRESTGLAG